MKLLAGLVAGVAAFVLALGRDAPVDAPEVERSRGAALFAEMGCGSCHAFGAAGARGTIAPDLGGLLAGHTRESLAAVIARPPSLMPQDFSDRMTTGELDALAGWLLATQAR